MYRAFFGFREKPFNLTPDPKFLYLNASYREALAALHYGIAERKGFVTLVGEAGTGKTTLLRRLLSELGPETRSVLVLNPSVGFDDLLAFILTDLGRPPMAGTPKLEMLEQLNAELLDTLARGGNVVVLIDEAQDLGIGVLEELRLLSNLETAKEKILQFVLAGQPELDEMLERRELRQLRQRIAVFARLRPLARREVEAYVAARIQAAGGTASELFSRAALFRLWRFSGGVPRLVNVAGDNALVTAYAAGKKHVGWRAVGEAVSDLRPSRAATYRPRRVRVGAIAVAAAVAVGVVLGLVGSRLSGRSTESPERPGAVAGSGGVDEHLAAPHAVAPSHEQVPTGDGDASAVASDLPKQPDPAAIAAAPVEAPAVAPADAARAPSAAMGPAQPDANASEPAPSDRTETAAVQPPGAPSGASGASGPAAGVPNDAGSDDTAKTAPTQERHLVSVRVEQGDTLTHIVRRYYGQDSPALITAVRQANPGISDPDVVLAGQTVQIPEPLAVPVNTVRPKTDAANRRTDSRTSKRRRRQRVDAPTPDTTTLYDDLLDDEEPATPERERP